MCKFFSFVMNDKGKIFYFDREQRMKFKEDNPDVFYTTIAKEYDVCATTISDIVNRKTWKHI